MISHEKKAKIAATTMKLQITFNTYSQQPKIDMQQKQQQLERHLQQKQQEPQRQLQQEQSSSLCRWEGFGRKMEEVEYV
jgi:hypothetical protein